MRAFLAVFVAVALFGAFVVADHVPYRYTINLDEAPEKRYYPAVRDLCRDPVHKGSFFALLQHLKETLLSDPTKTASALMMVPGMYQRRLPEVYQELTGISNYFQTYCGAEAEILTPQFLGLIQLIYQVSLGDVAGPTRDLGLTPELASFFTDFYKAVGRPGCTSVVVANETGHVIHGRNLDWPGPEWYQPLVTELTFVKNGKIVAVTTSFFPELSPTTLISPAVSFSYNARTAELEQVTPICVFGEGHEMDPFALVIRQKVFNGATYESLYADLQGQTFCSPAYIVLSGPGDFQGALFTTYLNQVPTIKTLNTPYNEDGDTRKPWYVAVANDDTEYSNREKWSPRYNQILSILESSDQYNITQTMERIDYDLLGVRGIWRDDGTCYATTMDVRSFTYNTIVRSLTVSGNQFHQDMNIPPEESGGGDGSSSSIDNDNCNCDKESSTQTVESVNGSAKHSPVMYAILTVFVALLSHVFSA